MSERNPQIEQGGTTANDEFAIERIDVGEAAGAVGTNQQLITVDDESPGLSVVTGRRQDSVANRKARFVYSCPRCRKAGSLYIPSRQVTSSHGRVPAHLRGRHHNAKARPFLGNCY